ncbi:MAG TPA: PKD domain-containing protein [Chitinophagales bacterium]|nr:PKD domain-containing protein [Chitinophagales bacterium]
MRTALRRTFGLIGFLFLLYNCSAQNFLNGDFEINTGFCIINGGNAWITANLSNSNAYGSGQEIDLMDNGCGYGTAYSGNYFLCLANSSGTSPDAITFTLDVPLVSGQAYTLYYHDRGYDVYGCCPPGVPIEVGVSTISGAQGTVVYTSPVPTTNVWSLRTVNFVAPNNGQYISFQAQNNNTRWTHIDCLSLGFSACCAPYTLNLTTVDATCNQNNGMAVAVVSGGGGPFTYLWSTLPIQTTDTAFNLGPGTYAITVTDTNGCSGTDSVTILNVNQLSLAVNPSSATICFGDSVTLTATGAASYSWNPSTGLNSTTDSVVLASPSSTTTYTLTGTYSACIDSVTVTVTVQPLPLSPFSIVPDSACTGTDVAITYTGGSSPAASYTWDFDGGIITSGSGQGPYQVHWDSGGTYIVSLTVIENGCTSLPTIDTVTIFAPPDPSFTISPPEICAGEMVGVTYTGNASASAIYVWGFGTGAILQGNGEGPYVLQYNTAGQEVVTLTVTEHGCPSSQNDTLQVDSIPIASFVASDTTGCDSLLVHFANLSSGASSYLWNFGDGTTDTTMNPSKTFDIGTYTVSLIVTSSNGCKDSMLILDYINVYQSPVAQFSVNPPANIPLFLKDALFQFTNSSLNAFSYEWNFGDTTLSTETNPLHQYTESGNFTVTLYAYNGTCVDSVALSFLMVEPNPGYFFPDGFTPNGDGINDVFSVLGFHLQSVNISIFNRWGQLIFQSSDIDHGWDGTYNGLPEETGVYVYLAGIVFLTGEQATAKGSITLIR